MTAVASFQCCRDGSCLICTAAWHELAARLSEGALRRHSNLRRCELDRQKGVDPSHRAVAAR